MTDSNGARSRVAVIGAGLAGLTCATALKGFADVQVFEKSVFVGGRVSRHQFSEYNFNHGEQFFTVSNPLFQSLVRAWQETGLVREWDGWIVELDHGQVVNLDNNSVRYIGYPHMQAISDTLAHSCEVKLSTSISELERQAEGGWRLFDDRGTYQGLFDIVIIATAANHVAPLARDVGNIARLAGTIDMTVCWTAMMQFGEPLNLPFDAAYVLNSPLAWISRFQQIDASQENMAESWVINATPEWSQEYVSSFRGRVMHALQEAFFEACDIEPVKALNCNVHCWKHALPINTLDQDCLFDEDAALGACGDWCTSPRIEGAVLSGFSMADRIMKYIGSLTAGPRDTTGR